MVNLLFIEDDDALTKPGIVTHALRPRLRHRRHAVRRRGPPARAQPAGAARGVRPGAERRDLRHLPVRHDDQGPGRRATSCSATRFSDDGHAGQALRLHARQPAVRRGVEEGRERGPQDEHETHGLRRPLRRRACRASTTARFLFLQHLISKMKPAEEGGRRLAIVFNGSPLFTGGAGSGESEIRRWIIENDWLEASSPCPTSCSTTPASPPTSGSSPTAKRPSGAARCSSSTPASFFAKMRKSLGRSARSSAPTQIDEITRLYGEFAEGEQVKIFHNEAFGYRTITVERPLRDAARRDRARHEGPGAKPDSRRCATPRTCRSARTSTSTSSARCCRTSPDAWIDERRRRSATRSRSTGTSTVQAAAPARGDRCRAEGVGGGDPGVAEQGDRVKLRDAGRWLSGGTPPRDLPEYWDGEVPWVSTRI